MLEQVSPSEELRRLMPPAQSISPTQGSSVEYETDTADGTRYVVSNHNRWSRVTLSFDGLETDAWYELSFQIQWDPQEESRSAHDIATIGVDFLTEDGSSVDFAYIPGLVRSQLDPHSWPIGGPDYGDYAHGFSTIRCSFFVPAPARNLSVSVRSWRNSHAFTIRDPKLRQNPGTPNSLTTSSESSAEAPHNHVEGIAAPRRASRDLSVTPIWFHYAFVPGRRLLIRGQILNEGPGSEGALVRLVYRDENGEALPPPYPEMSVAPAIGAYIDLPVHKQARRFTLDLTPPPDASAVEVGFQTWNDQAKLSLVMPLEVSLEDEFLLEAISGDEAPDALTFLRSLIARLEGTMDASEAGSVLLKQLLDLKAVASPFTIHDKLKALQGNGKPALSDDELTLADFPAWHLPETPQWSADPFQSPAWRKEYQSLSWLCQPAETGDETEGLVRSVDLALSWSHANPAGQPKDPISAHPLALSARTEAFLLLLSRSARSPKAVGSRKTMTLLAEVVRHAFALSEIVGQNVFAHSLAHIHAACALLSVSRALPRIPLAAYWGALALSHLRDGFDQMVDRHGIFVEQSLHFRLETASLGLILARHLEHRPEAMDLRDDLIVRLKKGLRGIVAATTPAGSLPPVGDAPYGYHHAAWLRRLLSIYGSALLSDPELSAELAYPTGHRIFCSPNEGIVAARHYERTAQWSYFYASSSGRQHEHGHFDCTSFVYSANGTPWIVDPRGSELHESGAARQFLLSSRAHNVALPDGREQTAGTGWIEARDTFPGASLFQIRTNVNGPEYDHRRVFVFLDGLHALAVFDCFTTQPRPVSFEGFLHFDPEIVVALASAQMGVAYRKDRRLRILPQTLRGQFTGLNLQNGCTDRAGSLQGFVARAGGGLQPANVLRYRFSGQGAVCGGVILAIDQRGATALSKLLKTAPVRSFFSRLLAAES